MKHANEEIEVWLRYVATLKKINHFNKLQIHIIFSYSSVSLNFLDVIPKTFAAIWPVSHIGT